ncbi:MAG: ABC transporter ATP-binding protein [Nitrospinae bacterium]|nr:ABC transporter ATP-binding protein [Nitrospinota bacterium]
MLEALGVSRRYGWRWALKDLNLSVSPGETLALLGKNGSGKTTLLKIFAGLLRPTEGTVRVGGEPISREAKGEIGLPGLTIRENLGYFAKLFGMESGDISGRVELLAETLGITDRLAEPVRVLSQGFRQRASLARALLHDPEVVLLDEPFSGLDPEAAGRLESVVRALCEHHARIVVFTTHDLSKAYDMAGRIAVLGGGRLAYEGNADNSKEEELLAAFDEFSEGPA